MSEEAGAGSPPEAQTASTGGVEVLARRAKEKQVAAFRQSLPDDHPIILELGKVGSYNESDKLYKALRRSNNYTISAVPEYARKAPWGYLGSILDPAVSGASLEGSGPTPLTQSCPPVSAPSGVLQVLSGGGGQCHRGECRPQDRGLQLRGHQADGRRAGQIVAPRRQG
jgi:hypothetical protein